MKFYLKRMKLSSGRYWSEGQPLYYYKDVETGNINGELRASNRDYAIEELCKLYPGAILFVREKGGRKGNEKNVSNRRCAGYTKDLGSPSTFRRE